MILRTIQRYIFNTIEVYFLLIKKNKLLLYIIIYKNEESNEKSNISSNIRDIIIKK